MAFASPKSTFIKRTNNANKICSAYRSVSDLLYLQRTADNHLQVTYETDGPGEVVTEINDKGNNLNQGFEAESISFVVSQMHQFILYAY